MNPHLYAILCFGLILSTSGCLPDSERDQKHEREISRMRNDYLTLVEQLRIANTDLEVEKASRERADKEIKDAREKADVLRKELEAVRMDFLNYRRDFQLQSRINAVGEKIATLKTTTGKVFNDVTIRAVLADTIQIAHTDGQARFLLANLGDDWLKRFDVGSSDPVCLIDEDTLKQACARAAKSSH